MQSAEEIEELTEDIKQKWDFEKKIIEAEKKAGISR